MTDKVYVAKLGKAVGLKGHLRLFIDSDFPEQFKKGATFVTNKNIKLIVSEYNQNRELISFQNYDDIDLAKKLTNQHLYVTQEETVNNCALQDNEFFWFDILDCTIFENQINLGKVKDIHRYPIDDYLEITTDKELVDKTLPKTFLIPYNTDSYIINVDIKNKRIDVKNCYEILENS